MLRRCLLATVCCLATTFSPAGAAEDRYFDSGGVKIHYTVEGQGEPVLLIHGFGSNLHQNWVGPGVAKALATSYRVIALDNRGHGRSEKPHEPEKYGLEMVEDAVRLLDHLGIDKAHVVGYSMGAAIANKLLATHPERVLTVTLGGAAGLREGDSTRFFDDLGDSLVQGKGIGPLIIALTPPGQPRPTEAMLKLIDLNFALFNDTKALGAVMHGMKALAVSDAVLKANATPILALIGDKDPLKRGVDALEGRLANLETVVVAGANHMDAPARPEFVAGLTQFLAKHARPGRPAEAYLAAAAAK
jgi:pimeloyl-ACP methyl ester carboxylesterase